MAGTVTYKKNKIWNNRELVEEHIFTWTADAADGSVPSTATPDAVTGVVRMPTRSAPFQ